jgi:hypothetical protein
LPGAALFLWQVSHVSTKLRMSLIMFGQ